MHRTLPILLCSTLAAACAALGAYAVAARRGERHVADRIAALAASVERLQSEPPPRQIVERHVTRELVRDTVDAPTTARPDPANDHGATTGAFVGPFDPGDVRDYRAGRGPHPAERRFERDRAGGRVATELQQRFETALGQAADGLDADVLGSECRATTCRLEVTFDSTATGAQFAERLGVAGPEGPPLFDHGGLYATLHEEVGSRHHSVFFVLRRDGSGG